MTEPESMEEQVQRIIEHNHRLGVMIQVDWENSAHPVNAVIWRPGDPNALAEAIMRHVKKRTTLELNGRKFWVEPQGTGDT